MSLCRSKKLKKTPNSSLEVISHMYLQSVSCQYIYSFICLCDRFCEGHLEPVAKHGLSTLKLLSLLDNYCSDCEQTGDVWMR